MTRPLEIRRPSAHEFALVVATGLAGAVTLLFPAATSRAIAGVFPDWATSVYYLGLVVGAFITLVGLGRFYRALSGHGDLDDALQIEAVGVLPLGCLCVAYALALATLGDPAAALPAASSLAVGIAHFWRIRQIVHDIRRFRAALRDPVLAEPTLADPEGGP